MFNIFEYTTYIRKLFTRKDVLLLLALVGLFLLTRLINLDRFPIFSDEGIYVHWAKVAWRDANWRFISLTDGRQPLQTWGTIPFLKLFESNALLAGRLFSVATGFFALSGLVALNTYLFNKKTGIIAGFLYIFIPYFLFFDRMALVDSAVNGFTIWMFFLSIVLARTRRLDVALILGFFAGFGMLAKSSMRLYVALMFCASIFILYENHEGVWGMIISLKRKIIGKDHKWLEMINFSILYVVSVGIAVLIYNVQRLSAFFHFVSEKNKTFILTFAELKADPFNYLSHNIINVPYYILSEMAFVVPVLAILGLILLYKKNKTLAIYLAIWLSVSYVGISLVARVLFPRYVLSIGGLLLIPAAYFNIFTE
jgi:4-amino-4-deoxy-L-arabinose transferase-like glycosyltransferase